MPSLQGLHECSCHSPTLHHCLLSLPGHGSTSRSAAPPKLPAAAPPRAWGLISLPPPPTHGGSVVSALPSALLKLQTLPTHGAWRAQGEELRTCGDTSGHVETHQGCAVPLAPRSAGDKALPTAAFSPSDNPRGAQCRVPGTWHWGKDQGVSALLFCF